MKGKQIFSFMFAATLILVTYYGQSLASESTLRAMEEEFINIVDQVSPAIVEITATKRNLIVRQQSSSSDNFHDFFFPQSQGIAPYEVSENVGTGIIFDKRGYIVTTESVVGKADKVVVTLADGRMLGAEVVGVDPETDVALVRVDARDLPIASLGNSENIKSGSWIITIGRSYGSSPTLSFGVVSGMEPLPGVPAYYDAIKINAAISPGNSGGGLIDMDGKLVGIITAALAEPRAIDFGFMEAEQPVVKLRADLKRMASSERLARAKLYSAQTDLEVMKGRYNAGLSLLQDMDKARLEYVAAQSQYENVLTDLERLVSRLGASFPHGQKLKEEIGKTQEQIRLVWDSEGSQEDIRKILDKGSLSRNTNILLKSLQDGTVGIASTSWIAQPQRARFFGRQEESFAIPISFAKTVIDDLMDDGKVERGWLGVFIRPVTYPDMEMFGLEKMEGVIVAKVIPDGPAHMSKIQKNDAIISFGGKEVKGKNSLVRMVSVTKPHTEIELTVMRDRQKQVLSVKIGEMPEK